MWNTYPVRHILPTPCHTGTQRPREGGNAPWPHSKIKTDLEMGLWHHHSLGRKTLSLSRPLGQKSLPLLCFSLHTPRDRQLTTYEAACSVAGWL